MEYPFRFRLKNLVVCWDSIGISNKEYNEGTFLDDKGKEQVKVIDGEIWRTDTDDGILKPMMWDSKWNDKDRILDDFCGFWYNGKLFREYGLCVEDGEVLFCEKPPAKK